MSEQIDPKSVKYDARHMKTADQRELAGLNVGASEYQKELNKDIPELYLVGKTVDGKPFAFNAKIVKDRVEISGFEFEGKKYQGSESFEVRFENNKLNDNDKNILQNALGSKSISIPKGGILTFGTKKTITFKEIGHVASLDVQESKEGDMKLALAQAAEPAVGFESAHKPAISALKPSNGVSIT